MDYSHYSSLHTHTVFCDGRDDVETMCRAAREKGLEAIGFSSHAPLTKKTGIKSQWHMREEKLEKYVETVLTAKKRWEGKLAVYLGLEVDYIPGLIGPADKDIQALPLDYVIGAVHYIRTPKKDAFFIVDAPPEEFCPTLRDLFNGDGEAICAAYFGNYGELAAAGGYDILAHLDLVKKNNSAFPFFDPESPAYKQLLLNTLDRIAAARGRGGAPVVEVNSGGMNRGRTSDPYPSAAILRLLRERKVPLIITSDAHKAEHLAANYEAARNAMIEAGYGEMAALCGGPSRWEFRRL